jgi:hypothetical protein
MGERRELERGDLYTCAHLKMEQALAMLDAAGENAASIHLDRAIVELGLRDDAVNRGMIDRLSIYLTITRNTA